MADYTFITGQSIRFGRKDTELTHLWDFGDNNTSTLSNPFHTYSSLGTYTVTHTAYNSCGTCVGGTTHTVDILANISDPSTADYKFLLGEEIHLNRRDTELTHSWNFGNGDISALPDLYYIYTVPGIYTVTHNAYNVCGTCVGEAAHTIEILAPPEGCPISPKYSGDTVTLNATPKDGIGPYYVEFQKNGVLINPSRLGNLDNPIIDAPEDTLITRVYTLDDLDISSASLGTIDFSVYMEDSCPTGQMSCTETCTITIGCLAPVCNFVVT